MRLPRLRTLLPILAVLLVVALGCGFWLFGRPPRVDMATFAPESALVYIEIDSLPEILDGLAETDAWERLSGPLGLTGEREVTGSLAAWLGELGIGSDASVVLGRSQFAVVVTGVEAQAEPSAPDDPSAATLVVKPRFALFAKTHAGEATSRSLATERFTALARRAYGEGVVIADVEYGEETLSVAHPPDDPERQMVWAVHDDLIIIANDGATARSVLDTVNKKAPALAGNFYFERVREAVGADEALVSAYTSPQGLGGLVGGLPGIVASAVPEGSGPSDGIARLVRTVAERTLQAAGYSGRFEEGRFVERVLVLPTPQMAEPLARIVEPTTAEPRILDLVPSTASEVTLLRVERPGETADSLLTLISANVDVNVAATVTQLAIELRRQYGVVAEEPVSPMLGDQIAIIGYPTDESSAIVFDVRDPVALDRVVGRYLTADGYTVVGEERLGARVLRSTNPDGRAAAFVGRHLVLGTPEQISRLLEARSAGGGAADLLARSLESHGDTILGRQGRDESAADLARALARLADTSATGTDALDRPGVAEAIASLPPAVSLTHLRDGTLVTETRSSIGRLSYLTGLL